MNKKYAILVVDMLNDFVTGVIGCDNAKAIVKPTQELLEEASIYSDIAKQPNRKKCALLAWWGIKKVIGDDNEKI